MKSHLFSLIVACLLLVSCDRQEITAGPPSPPGTPPGQKNGNLEDSFSREVLPGNRERFQPHPGDEIDPRMLAHDTPSMEKEARGPYSYQGAAREFKDICGVSMPDWVQPTEGEYSVGKISEKFVSQARLEYKIDPLRRDELELLITEATARRRTQLPRLVFGLQPIENAPPAKFTSYTIKVNAHRSDKITIGLFADGTVKLFNARGPEGWDQ